MPVILAPVPTSAIDALLDRIDALCLSGGPDIHPSAYGATEHPEVGPTEPELDRFEQRFLFEELVRAGSEGVAPAARAA
jgi:putative glutamine amidotransferase